MADVAFEEEKSLPGRPAPEEPRGLPAALVKAGVVASEGQAVFILAALAALMIIAAIYIFLLSREVPHQLTPVELQSLEEMKASGNR